MLKLDRFILTTLQILYFYDWLYFFDETKIKYWQKKGFFFHFLFAILFEEGHKIQENPYNNIKNYFFPFSIKNWNKMTCL